VTLAYWNSALGVVVVVAVWADWASKGMAQAAKVKVAAASRRPARREQRLIIVNFMDNSSLAFG
jgi:hypothetical protein